MVHNGKALIVLPEDEFFRLRERLADPEDMAELDRAIATEANRRRVQPAAA